MTNEYDAMNQLANSKNQAQQDARKAFEAKVALNEQLRKQRINGLFWERVRKVLTTLAFIIILATIFRMSK
ncbi:MAG: hypothetical protein BAX61_13380 [Psychrobacter sp. B29-1]|jgi:hypothetical protein|uniref:hypothetical protein n=1 Tax=Psychrobacter sp. B29-1 TaxID=1867800 RepID=UPI00086D7883|nr:hypothetical protein [Psychrobacter sp. B29-1]OEH66791.1 MAG: hypothetical protein BAX61_13380 [Psychrobacter sp. B29-1]